ncbi:MAG: hypothetical protein DRQ46_06350 [Gammaproteobacteria bacterium]|nr:MAG: hypothetical protein DRQ46_06350 [Gammaproteobacteria bacterium]
MDKNAVIMCLVGLCLLGAVWGSVQDVENKKLKGDTMQETSELVGVSLIDKFAMAALSGLLQRGDGDIIDPELFAKDAYRIANAMMEQRLKRTESRYGKKKQ